MPKFYSWSKVAKALGRLGFRIARQRGSHIIFKNDGTTHFLFLEMMRLDRA